MNRGFAVVLTLMALVVSYVYLASSEHAVSPRDITDDVAQVRVIADSGGGFRELADFFVHIATLHGGVHAFSVLRESVIPPNIDVHLLGHLVGDELYKQEGLTGMQHCTPEFRNACSHTIVVGALLEFGDGVFDDIHDVCKLAPGGRGAYTMCFHGFGHGVLAYNEYEMTDAVRMCKRVGTQMYNEREYAECVGGAIMEMMSGVHDPAVWRTKSKQYLKDGDPLYLCRSEVIPEDVKGMCYVYVSPLLFEAAGTSIGTPDPVYFEKAFSYCNEIPISEEENRDACFGGLGKEFVVLVKGRDVRDVSSMSDVELNTLTEWCALAGSEDGVLSCNSQVLSSLYWGGENPVETPVAFCNKLTEGVLQDACIFQLIDDVEFYVSDQDYRSRFCPLLPEPYTNVCKETLE